MDVTKLPPLGAAPVQTPATSPGELGVQTPAKAVGDLADIRPLGLGAALQILLAEVRDAFDQQALLMGGDGSGSAAPDNPAQAARALVEMALQSLPAGPDVAAWTEAQVNMEAALQSSLQRAIDAVSAWRDVPAVVVDATKETRALVFSILGDEPPNPLWLRPEWAGLAPRFERFRRRRRIARRRLTDPDYASGSFDDDNEHRS